MYIMYNTYIKLKKLEMGSPPKKYREHADMPYVETAYRHIGKHPNT